jgi:hypothetical protein
MKKITDSELSEIQEVQKNNQDLVAKIGNLEFSRISLNIEYENLKGLIFESKKREADILEKLSQKYGDVMIDPNTGIISEVK